MRQCVRPAPTRQCQAHLADALADNVLVCVIDVLAVAVAAAVDVTDAGGAFDDDAVCGGVCEGVTSADPDADGDVLPDDVVVGGIDGVCVLEWDREAVAVLVVDGVGDADRV